MRLVGEPLSSSESLGATLGFWSMTLLPRNPEHMLSVLLGCCER